MSENQIIFNITIKISESISDDWLQKMQSDYLPPCTDGHIIVTTQINTINPSDSTDKERTYAVQFSFANLSVFEKNKLSSMKKFLDLLDQDFRGQYVYFTTTMERVYHNSIINN